MSVGRLDRSRERGAVVVMMAVLMPVMVGFLAFAIDAAHWWVHQRHLQTQADAGALAGAFGPWLPTCNEAQIEQQARNYGGDPASGPLYNAQYSNANNVTVRINSKNYAHQGGVDFDDGGTPCQTLANGNGFLDLKVSESNLANFFGVIPGFGSISFGAHARVSIRALDTVSGALPFAVPDPAPRYVFAQFINEASGAPLAGCSVAACEVQLAKAGTSAGGLTLWNNVSGPVAVPIGANRIGVRVRLVSALDPTLPCGSLFVECYDSPDGGSLPTQGILFIRGYSSAGGTANPPQADDVSLFNGSCQDPYFVSSAASCTVGVHAKVAFPSGVTPSTSCTGGGGPLGNGSYVEADTDDGQAICLHYNSSTGYWDSAGTDFVNVSPNAGPITVSLHWTVKGNVTINGNGCKNGQGCQGDFTNVQRVFSADPTRSGSIQQATVSEGATQWTNSFVNPSTHNLVVQLGLTASLADASSASDPPVKLRVISGSLNQSLDCDPNISNIRDEIGAGCGPLYTKNPGTTCVPYNQLWSSPQPWNCVKTQTGGSIGQVSQGMEDRILCGGQHCKGNPSCTAPNNWSVYWAAGQTPPVSDPRRVFLLTVPLGSFTGSGNAVVPVQDIGLFYVTGWGGNGSSGGDPCAGADPAKPGYVVGHFFKYVDSLPSGTGQNPCNPDPKVFGTCVAVLTQ
jgi:Putative Flp pilus-assembly TadE/G-like